ncbi:MAG: LysR family transcriptional regulator [Gracilibacter sp. BRH_c7a]|nr:MAG: LysR family transcriptional regulator [Gracilibacter sp. BRH_c7a]
MEQDTYLNNPSQEEVLKIMIESLGKHCLPQNESVDVRLALGRITGETIHAKRSSPHYCASAMDGYGVRAEDTFGAKERHPVWLDLDRQAIKIDTGDQMPEGMNAVLIWEKVLSQTDKGILINQPVVPWDNVRTVGEDIVEGEVILPVNHRIRPQDQGALLAGGLLEIMVRRKPKVGILPTGDEIRPPEYLLQSGEIVDSNSTVLSSLVEEWGGSPRVWPINSDKLEQLEKNLLQISDSQDIVIIIAGTSRGRDDYTSQIIKKHGTIYAHGTAIKPGKPVILGQINRKPVIGIPGYPVSAFITAQIFLEVWVKHLLGLKKNAPPLLQAVLSKKVYSSLGSEEFVRMKVGKVKEKWIASPIGRGAGLTMSLVRADGILRVPRLQEGFHEGDTVEIELLRPLEELEKTLVSIGSHDLTLDLITSHLKASCSGAVASAHVGSMAGIMALRKGEAHFAGIHLLDPQTGDYNISYLKRFLPDQDITLLNLVYRTQGLIVPKGNPLRIKDLSDLSRDKVIFINRQAGSGTRVLLDYLLEQKEISKEEITGYEREEFTHLGVAIAVASGSADVGLGIQSAAVALGLDFIPIGEERYDLAVPTEYLKYSLMQKMLDVIRSEEFKTEVLALGGYDTRDTGKAVKTNK